MNCPNCRAHRGQVTDSREKDGTIRRRRHCPACDHRWTTYEMSDVEHAALLERNRRVRQAIELLEPTLTT